MIGYHYSPAIHQESILKRGLLVPLKHPKLTEPTVCSEGHRNPHISLATNPVEAWMLSGGFLFDRSKEYEVDFKAFTWDLYQVNLNGIRYYKSGAEIQVRKDIPRHRVHLIGFRWIHR